MININELRQLTRRYVGMTAWSPTSPQELIELLDRLEVAEKERDELRAKIYDLTINVEYLSNLKKSYEELIGEIQEERDALRSKIAEMERREVGFRERCTPSSPTGYSNRFPLYALPGAKGEKK